MKNKLFKSLFAVAMIILSMSFMFHVDEKSVVYAAAEGTMMSNAKEIEFGETYFKAWTSDTDHLNHYCKIEVPSRGILTFTFTKPFDSEGEYGRLKFVLYNEDKEAIFDPVTYYTVDDAFDSYEYNIGLDKGTYYLTVQPGFYVRSGFIETYYSMSFEENEYCEVEGNETLGTATVLEFGETYTAYYGKDGGDCEEYDYFKINMVAGVQYKIAIGGQFSKITTSTTLINLLDPKGNDESLKRDLEDMVDDNGVNYVIYTASQTGAHYLKFRNYSQEQYRYTVCVSEKKESLDGCTIYFADNMDDSLTVSYTGKEKKPDVVIYKEQWDLGLVEGVDYEVSYKNNKNIGTATVTVTGIGKYEGSISAKFKITAKKGATFTSDGYKYKVTGSSTVAFNGIKSTKTTKVIIPKTVKYGGKTFKVTSIADGALKKKTKVTQVTIGSNVKTIGVSAFEGCKKLSKITIASAVTTIDDKAFKNCTALKSITIPSKVTKIDKQAFYGCKNLKTITIKSTKLKTVGDNTFKGINSKAKIKVPGSKLKSYKKLLADKGQGSKVKILKY